jgi:hypothetical protein
LRRAIKIPGTSFLFALVYISIANSQDLDPRAYARVPVNGTVLISNFTFSKGGVVTDPTLPLRDLEASVEASSVGVAHTFRLFGQTAQAFAVLPYGWAQASAIIGGQSESITRSGLADMRLRCSVLLLGGKAATLEEFSKILNRTVLGTSLTVIVPTGQYFHDKLINLGTSRWSFKPEVAFSQMLGKRWMIDFFTGIWFFTTNNSYYPGASVRTQKPLVAFQTHISYNVNPRTWVAFNATYYNGGKSNVNGINSDDKQANSRLGCTLALPVGKRSSLKIAYSTGVIIRMSADFTTVSVGWTSTWFGKAKASKSVIQ